MTGWQIFLGVLLILISIVIIVLVMSQESKQGGLSSAITGGSDSFLGQGKSRSKEATLARITKVIAAIFFVVTLATTLLLYFL